MIKVNCFKVNPENNSEEEESEGNVWKQQAHEGTEVGVEDAWPESVMLKEPAYWGTVKVPPTLARAVKKNKTGSLESLTEIQPIRIKATRTFKQETNTQGSLPPGKIQGRL